MLKRKEIDEKVKSAIVQAFVGEELKGFVENNIGIDFRKILEGEITPYVQKLINQSFYYEFQKGNRTDLEFVRELIYSRCVELKLAQNWGDVLLLDGSDKDCLITRYTNHRSDFKVLHRNEYYEVVSCYSGHFGHLHSLYLSSGKMEALMNNAKKNIQYLIAVDVMFQEYYILEIRSDIDEMPYVKKIGVEDGGYYLSLKGAKKVKLGEEEFVDGSLC